MNSSDYGQLSGDLFEYATSIQTSKRPGYTIGSEDVLANFKRVGDRLGVTAEVAWGVYFLKHIDAITTAMAKPHLPVSEELKGRFADAINYLFLGYALHVERERYLSGEDKRPEFKGTATPHLEPDREAALLDIATRASARRRTE